MEKKETSTPYTYTRDTVMTLKLVVRAKLLDPSNISTQVSRKGEGKRRTRQASSEERNLGHLLIKGEKSARRTPIGVDDRHELQNRTVDVLPFVKVFRARV